MSEALILGTAMIAQATAFAPNYNTAINAAVRLFQLIDRKPKIDSTGAAGLKLVKLELRYFMTCYSLSRHFSPAICQGQPEL